VLFAIAPTTTRFSPSRPPKAAWRSSALATSSSVTSLTRTSRSPKRIRTPMISSPVTQIQPQGLINVVHAKALAASPSRVGSRSILSARISPIFSLILRFMLESTSGPEQNRTVCGAAPTAPFILGRVLPVKADGSRESQSAGCDGKNCSEMSA